jgi:hypothetical protein
MLLYLFVTVLVFNYLCLFIYQISIFISDLMLFNNGFTVCRILDNISFRSHYIASLRISFDINDIFLYFHNVTFLILSHIDINYFRTPILKQCPLFTMLMSKTIGILIYISLCRHNSTLF